MAGWQVTYPEHLFKGLQAAKRVASVEELRGLEGLQEDILIEYHDESSFGYVAETLGIFKEWKVHRESESHASVQGRTPETAPHPIQGWGAVSALLFVACGSTHSSTVTVPCLAPTSLALPAPWPIPLAVSLHYTVLYCSLLPSITLGAAGWHTAHLVQRRGCNPLQGPPHGLHCGPHGA